MMRRIVLGFSILAGWTLAGPPALAASDSPRALIDEIFGQVDTMCGGDGNGPAYDLYEIAKAHFTPALEKTFETAMGSDDFGFDVLIDAQDCKTSDLKLSIVSQGDATATGRATFKNMGEDRVINLIMVKPGADWKVDDIAYGHRQFSLKAVTFATPERSNAPAN
jgi:hypothetical protein